MNKRGSLIVRIVGMILLLATISFVYTLYTSHQMNKNECLIEIAEDVCKEKGLMYEGVYLKQIVCIEDERSTEYKRFKFTDEEWEECT